MYYYRARYYDATLGRFLSEDPAGFADSHNLYNYVASNALNWIDPFGFGRSRADRFYSEPRNTAKQIRDYILGFSDSVPFLGPQLEKLRGDNSDCVSGAYRAGQETAIGLEILFFLLTVEVSGPYKAVKGGNSFIRNNVFRWGIGNWKQGGKWIRNKVHFHLAPAMKHHLPYQFRSWFHHSKDKIIKFINKFKDNIF